MLATTFLTFLWSLIVIFFMVIFFILLFHVIVDLFSRHDASGWKKAAWVFFLIVFPFIGLFAYYIVNGDGMAQRQMKQVQQAQTDMDSYIKTRRDLRRSDRADREGEVPPRRRDDHAGRVRQAEGQGARLTTSAEPTGKVARDAGATVSSPDCDSKIGIGRREPAPGLDLRSARVCSCRERRSE